MVAFFGRMYVFVSSLNSFGNCNACVTLLLIRGYVFFLVMPSAFTLSCFSCLFH